MTQTVISRVTESIIFVEKKLERVIITRMKPRNHERSPDKRNFSIALPKTMIDDLSFIAKEETRSRNGQIECFLAQSVKEWKAAHPDGKPNILPMVAESHDPTFKPTASKGPTSYAKKKTAKPRLLKKPDSDDRKAN